MFVIIYIVFALSSEKNQKFSMHKNFCEQKEENAEACSNPSYYNLCDFESSYRLIQQEKCHKQNQTYVIQAEAKVLQPGLPKSKHDFFKPLFGVIKSLNPLRLCFYLKKEHIGYQNNNETTDEAFDKNIIEYEQISFKKNQCKNLQILDNRLIFCEIKNEEKITVSTVKHILEIKFNVNSIDIKSEKNTFMVDMVYNHRFKDHMFLDSYIINRFYHKNTLKSVKVNRLCSFENNYKELKAVLMVNYGDVIITCISNDLTLNNGHTSNVIELKNTELQFENEHLRNYEDYQKPFNSVKDSYSEDTYNLYTSPYQSLYSKKNTVEYSENLYEYIDIKNKPNGFRFEDENQNIHNSDDNAIKIPEIYKIHPDISINSTPNLLKTPHMQNENFKLACLTCKKKKPYLLRIFPQMNFFKSIQTKNGDEKTGGNRITQSSNPNNHLKSESSIELKQKQSRNFNLHKNFENMFLNFNKKNTYTGPNGENIISIPDEVLNQYLEKNTSYNDFKPCTKCFSKSMERENNTKLKKAAEPALCLDTSKFYNNPRSRTKFAYSNQVHIKNFRHGSTQTLNIDDNHNNSSFKGKKGFSEMNLRQNCC